MIAIINHNMGNLRSVEKAIELCGGEPIITNKISDLEKAEKIVLPGVGAFKNGMDNLHKLNLVKTLNQEILKNKKPFLGICLGMQLLANKSYEFETTKGLEWIDADILPLPKKNNIKIPHVGWNDIKTKKNPTFFNRLNAHDKSFYFVHSFFMKNHNSLDVLATSVHGIEFTAAIKKDNIFATQFHPEKSQENGLDLLTEFINWKI